jgi:hypothetical protein
MDTAAVMQHLNLVICSDSAVAHLAGALGVPVWLALPHVPDWRWLLGRPDSPWYPTMRLYRQTRAGDWHKVFERIAADLESRVHEPRAFVEISPGELLDRITILEIRLTRLTALEQRDKVAAELVALRSTRAHSLPASDELDRLGAELRLVNETLWQVEDDLRLCERAGDHGPRFIHLARSVCQHNDHRYHLKRRINVLLGCRGAEEKIYPP